MTLEFKGYYIKPHKQYPNNYVVSTSGIGGKIPDILGGLFTSTGVAKQAILRYLEGKAPESDKKISKG